VSVAFISLGLGVAVGYLAQRGRLCFVAGLRDWLLFRETALLSAVLAFLAASWIAWPLAALAGGAALPEPVGSPGVLLIGLALGGGLCLGLASVLANGCPLRQHVLAAQGNGDAWAYLAGFAAGALAYQYLLLPLIAWLL